MRRRSQLMALFFSAWTFAGLGQPTLTRGDVLVSGDRDVIDAYGFPDNESNVRVFGADGSFKRDLIPTTTENFFTDTLYRDGIVYVSSRGPQAILRVDEAGNVLAPFTTQVYNVNYLSPGPQGGLLVANGSGEISQFAPDGTRVRFRDFTQHPRAYGGIELGYDQCTVFYATSGSLVRWNTCLNTPAEFYGPNLAAASQGLRLLPDGTFLVSVIGLFPGTGNNCIIHVDRDGNLIRSYPIPGRMLALDIDGTSFWTGVGNTLVKADIASGAILSLTHTGFRIFGLSVVGESRAGFAAATDIPTASSVVLITLVLALAAVALIRLR